MSVSNQTAKALLAPELTAGVGTKITGSWVDLQGIIGDRREVMAILQVGNVGTSTAGTVDGTIQSSPDTAGSSLTTRATFTQRTSAGGIDSQFAACGTDRYVRFLGTVQSGKTMNVAVGLVGVQRYG